jgi:hypothetical protein
VKAANERAEKREAEADDYAKRVTSVVDKMKKELPLEKGLTT